MDTVTNPLLVLMSLPLTALLWALMLQRFTKIACGFIPKYWQAYRAIITPIAIITVAHLTAVYFGAEPRIIGIIDLAGLYVQTEIYSHIIKNGSQSIGFKKAMLIMAIQFLVLGMLVSAVLIFPAPTIKARAILAIIGIACFSIMYEIAKRAKPVMEPCLEPDDDSIVDAEFVDISKPVSDLLNTTRVPPSVRGIWCAIGCAIGIMLTVIVTTFTVGNDDTSAPQLATQPSKHLDSKFNYIQRMLQKYDDLFPDKKTPSIKQPTGLFDDLLADPPSAQQTQKTTPIKFMPRSQFYIILNELAPNWKTFNNDKGFNSYLSKNNLNGIPLSQVIRERFDRFDASGVAKIFNEYNREHN